MISNGPKMADTSAAVIHLAPSATLRCSGIKKNCRHEAERPRDTLVSCRSRFAHARARRTFKQLYRLLT